MNNKQLYERFVKLEKKLKEISDEISTLRIDLMKDIDYTSNLELENRNLRNRLDYLQNSTDINSQSRISLKKLYDDGFHICHAFYGSRRNNEECMFCDNIIYGEYEEKER